MRVEGRTALAWRRGRYVGLPTLKGPRPPPLCFGPLSATQDELVAGGAGADFGARARLHSFDYAHLVIGPGDDGAIITGGLESIVELCAFTQLGHGPRPLELAWPLQDEILENMVVGVDGASFNYYHWLVNALARARLCADVAPEGSTIALPDYAGRPDGGGRVRSAVLAASTQTVLRDRRHRLLEPGIYRVRGLHALWTRPTAPTDISSLAGLYGVFDDVVAQHAAPQRRVRRRLFFSRLDVSDQRIPSDDRHALSALLDRFSFETLDLGQMSFSEQVQAAAEAEVIVAPHGAGLTNLLFSPRNCVVIELVGFVQSEAVVRPWYYQLCTGRGQRYGAIHVSRQGWVDELGIALRRCLT